MNYECMDCGEHTDELGFDWQGSDHCGANGGDHQPVAV